MEIRKRNPDSYTHARDGLPADVSRDTEIDTYVPNPECKYIYAGLTKRLAALAAMGYLPA